MVSIVEGIKKLTGITLVAEAQGSNGEGWLPAIVCAGQTVWTGQTRYEMRTRAVEAAERTVRRAIGELVSRYEVVLESPPDKFRRQ